MSCDVPAVAGDVLSLPRVTNRPVYSSSINRSPGGPLSQVDLPTKTSIFVSFHVAQWEMATREFYGATIRPERRLACVSVQQATTLDACIGKRAETVSQRSWAVAKALLTSEELDE